MLISPPPGYSPSSINRQNVRNVPGSQGLVPQGYTPAAPAGTMLPAAYAAPAGSALGPQRGPGAPGLPGNPLAAGGVAAMIRALSAQRGAPR